MTPEEPDARPAEPFRGLVVPILGPLWILLPVAVWLFEFGHLILARIAGEGGSIAGKLGALLLLVGWVVHAAAQLARSPVPIDTATLRCLLVLLLQLLVGAGFLLLLGPGIVPVESILLRALLGAALIVTAWFGLSGITSPSRRLALSVLRGRGPREEDR